MKIAFLGLGIMGGPMAANLAKQHTVTAWNRTADAPGVAVAAAGGCHIVESVEAAVTGAEVVMTCVSDTEAVLSVLVGERGALSVAERDALFIDFSTIGPQGARRVDVQVRAAHARFLDAPVSGGDVGARAGTLAIMVGGEEADFARAVPLLQLLGKTVHHCGRVGSGQAIKLANQLLCAIHTAAVAEALSFAQLAGASTADVLAVCPGGAAGSWALSHLGPKMAEEDFRPGFPIKHMLKDLRLVKRWAQHSLPVFDAAYEAFELVAQEEPRALEDGTQAVLRNYQD